jgi:hypothetical protein
MNEFVGPIKLFSQRLSAKGFAPHRRDERGFIGLKIRDDLPVEGQGTVPNRRNQEKERLNSSITKLMRLRGESERAVLLEGGEGRTSWFPKTAVRVRAFDNHRSEVVIEKWLVEKKKQEGVDVEAWPDYQPSMEGNDDSAPM